MSESKNTPPTNLDHVIAVLAQCATGFKPTYSSDSKEINLGITIYPHQTCQNPYDVSLGGLRNNDWTKDAMVKLDDFVTMLKKAGIKADIINRSRCEAVGTSFEFRLDAVYEYEAGIVIRVTQDKDFEIKLQKLFADNPNLANQIKSVFSADLEAAAAKVKTAADLLPNVQGTIFSRTANETVRNILGGQAGPVTAIP